MDGDTAREGVVDGQVPDVCGRVVAALFIHITGQVEVNRVLAHQLLPHVLQLHALQMCRLKAQCKLGKQRQESGGGCEAFPGPSLLRTFHYPPIAL